MTYFIQGFWIAISILTIEIIFVLVFYLITGKMPSISREDVDYLKERNEILELKLDECMKEVRYTRKELSDYIRDKDKIEFIQKDKIRRSQERMENPWKSR